MRHHGHSHSSIESQLCQTLTMDFLGDSQGATGYIVNEDLVALNKAWCTEANAQEILPFKADVVELLQEKLTSQQVCSRRILA
jgi:hypothetical protein